MMEVWQYMGVIRYPVTFAWIAVLVLSAYSASRVFGWNAKSDLVTKAWIDSVFFWGGFGMISGMFGTLMGWIITAQSAESVAAVSPPLLWGGLKVSLYSSAVGGLLLCLSALIWFVLQFRWRVLHAEAMEGDVADVR